MSTRASCSDEAQFEIQSDPPRRSPRSSAKPGRRSSASCRASTPVSASRQRSPEVACRRPDPALHLASILSFWHPRAVARDNAVQCRWRTPQLLPVAASRRAFAGGLLHGYRTEEETLSTVCGRIAFAEQLRRRFDIPLPVEVRYDDFTDDITANRLVKAAGARLRGMRIGDRRSRGGAFAASRRRSRTSPWSRSGRATYRPLRSTG